MRTRRSRPRNCTNIATIVPGRSEETIIVVAHRDNAGADEPLGENASGTATLIELARGFAPQELGPDPIPQHTLVLLSSDAGAFGGAGAARFVSESALAARAIAVVILDDLGRGRPRLAIAGDDSVSPARTLRTAAVASPRKSAPPLVALDPAQLVGPEHVALDEQAARRRAVGGHADERGSGTRRPQSAGSRGVHEASSAADATAGGASARPTASSPTAPRG
jgi:hypothetical protein